ncbi:MAG: phage/plasmid primase, P4 family [Thermoplasmatota archaeon]
MATMLDAALAYAQRGWPVFPLRPRSKEPLTAHGFKDATTDATQVRAWWTTHPQANIGIATGRTAGIVVLDVDAKTGGLETARHLEDTHGSLGRTPLVLTPGGGRHAYFQHPGTEMRSRAGIAPGMDVRTDGGYVVAPPSVHPNAGTYAWHLELGESTPLAALPSWLLDLMTSRNPNSPNRSPRITGEIREGTRHAAFMSRAGTLRRQGRDQEEILADLLAMRQRVEGEFPLQELQRIASDAAHYDPGPIPCTDKGNVQRFLLLHGRDVLFDHRRRKAWMVWDGRRWMEDWTGAVGRFALDVPKAILTEAAEASDETTRKELARWALESQAYRRLRDMLSILKDVVPAPLAFDGDPWLLNVENGTLNLQTGALQPHRREDHITRLAPVHFDPAAACPTWDAALLAIMAGRPDMVAYTHRVLGSALCGVPRDQVLHIMWGTGGNGKSTILSIARTILGEYAGTIRTDVLLEQHGSDSATEDVARLDGLRMVTAVETRDGGHLNEALVKALTGGDKISASYKYGHVFEFTPQFTPILATNHRPHVREDDAIWRRIRLLPFIVRFAGPDEDPAPGAASRDLNLTDRLQSELPGVLNRLLGGCLEWQRTGLAPPPAAKEATREYRREEDALLRFLEDACEREENAAVLASDLRASYEAWCTQNDEQALSAKTVGVRLASLGFRAEKKNSGMRYWRGLRLGQGASGASGAWLPTFPYTRARVDDFPEHAPYAPHAPQACEPPLEEAQRLLRCAIREHEVLDGDAARETVLAAAEKEGIPRNRAEALLDHMLHVGALMEPRAQRYRLVRP